MAFVPAEGAVLVEESAQGSPNLQVFPGGRSGEVIDRGLRHDLSPVDTSQVTGVIGGDESVGDEEVIPAIVVEVDEL